MAGGFVFVLNRSSAGEFQKERDYTLRGNLYEEYGSLSILPSIKIRRRCRRNQAGVMEEIGFYKKEIRK